MANREQAQQTIEDIQQAVDETKKSDSIRRVEQILDRSEVERFVVGADDLRKAIDDYKGIERKGLTPEEYREEKESAFEDITEAVDGLDIDEDALKELEEEEIEKLPPAERLVPTKDEIYACDWKYTIIDLQRLTREHGLSPSGNKRDLCRRLLVARVL